MAFKLGDDTKQKRDEAERLIQAVSGEPRTWRLISLGFGGGGRRKQLDGFKGTEAQARYMVDNLHKQGEQ